MVLLLLFEFGFVVEDVGRGVGDDYGGHGTVNGGAGGGRGQGMTERFGRSQDEGRRRWRRRGLGGSKTTVTVVLRGVGGCGVLTKDDAQRPGLYIDMYTER